MGNVLALDLLYDGIVQVFADDADPEPSPVIFKFGWREPYMQLDQGEGGANRIVLHPGLPGAQRGRFGGHEVARKPGRDPRPLVTRVEYFTVFIWAYDASSPTDERIQWRAARMLYDAFDRAVYLVTHSDGDAGPGPVSWISEDWNLDKVERGFGAEIIVSGSIEAMVPDEKFTTVSGVTASIDVNVKAEVNEVNT